MHARKTNLLAGVHHDPKQAGGEPRIPSPLLSAASDRRTDDAGLPAPYPGPTWYALHDPLLLTAFAVCALLIGYQVAVTLLHPPWLGPVTDWLRTALAWPQLLLVGWVSLQLSRSRHPAARSWWMWSAALLSYAIAQTLWAVYDQLSFHHMMPFPSLPDLFYLVQYPFFFLAVILLPRTRFWGSRLILTVDDLLVIGAATALSWSFILAPLYAASGVSPLAREVSLAYPIGDLFVLFALTVTLRRPDRFRADLPVQVVLVLALVCLIAADSWAAWLDLRPPHTHGAGNPPDAFWFAFYLLIPLAGLCQLRTSQHARRWNGGSALQDPGGRGFQADDFATSLRLFIPVVVALLASGAIIIHVSMEMTRVGWGREIVPLTVSAGLLLLSFARQELTFLEIAQLRRQAEYARASEQAMRELDRRKDEFLGIVCHELKTPLASLQGYLELLSRRFAVWQPTDEKADALKRNIAAARTVMQYSEESLLRIARLVDDLLDDSRIRDGRLAFHFELCDLGAIVRKAVEEQRVLVPDRTIDLEAPAATCVPVMADARRIAQVVTNYVTNALKYSKEDRPIEVCLKVSGDMARVSVRDHGIGVPADEQAHVWERFHPIEGNKVQSGSCVSLGIGLHISRSIIEGHHGHVGVESAPGQGSTFWFTLPLAPSAT